MEAVSESCLSGGVDAEDQVLAHQVVLNVARVHCTVSLMNMFIYP